MGYAFITDLPTDWNKHSSQELESLSNVWKEQYDKIHDNRDIKLFNERLTRRWAIETGIIEGLYSIDRGTTELLIEKGFSENLISHGAADKDSGEIILLLQDQKSAIDGIFDFVASRRELSTSYIKELHQLFTRHQNYVTVKDTRGSYHRIQLIKGNWKNAPNNPVRENGTKHEYCPPEHVAQEMDNLIKWHKEHIKLDVPPEVESAWLHHRFTQIHPFQDGNGRVARSLASLIFLRDRLFPIVVTRDDREAYIEALEKADHGDLSPLIALFTTLQKREIVRAISISGSLLEDRLPLRNILDSAKEKLQRRMRNEYPYENVYNIATHLKEITFKKFNDIVLQLNVDLHNINRQYSAEAVQSDNENSYWFKSQIIKMAKEYDYFADTTTYHKWIRLKIREERQTDIIVSFHVVGSTFIGVMAGSAFLEHRDRDEHLQTIVDGPYKLSSDIFQFSYREDKNAVGERFVKWIEDVIIIGLEMWRKQI